MLMGYVFFFKIEILEVYWGDCLVYRAGLGIVNVLRYIRMWKYLFF